jgi:hypothetical protein
MKMTDEIPEDVDEIQQLIEQFDVKLPKDWVKFTREQKLDFIAHRILLDTRGTTKHSEMKEQGWLSDYQIERRRRREVLSKFGDWSEIPPKPGVFSRTYITDTVSITPPTIIEKKDEKDAG